MATNRSPDDETRGFIHCVYGDSKTIFREDFVEKMVSDENCSWLLSLDGIKARMQERFGDEETIQMLEMQN